MTSSNPTPPRLDAEELGRLRAIAEAAMEDWSAVQIGVGGGMRATETVPAYIAAFNPPTILALLDAQPAEGGSEIPSPDNVVHGLAAGDPVMVRDMLLAFARTREELEEARAREHSTAEMLDCIVLERNAAVEKAEALEAELSAAREAPAAHTDTESGRTYKELWDYYQELCRTHGYDGITDVLSRAQRRDEAMKGAEEALEAARDFAESEAENRGYAGADMSDYVNEAREVEERCLTALSALRSAQGKGGLTP